MNHGEPAHREIRHQFSTYKVLMSDTELLEQICHTLIDEDWDLEGLRKDISDNVWESFGFKVGTLARLRHEIRPFKLQRQEEED